jgi:hypothetical protein
VAEDGWQRWWQLANGKWQRELTSVVDGAVGWAEERRGIGEVLAEATAGQFCSRRGLSLMRSLQEKNMDGTILLWVALRGGRHLWMWWWPRRSSLTTVATDGGAVWHGAVQQSKAKGERCGGLASSCARG